MKNQQVKLRMMIVTALFSAIIGVLAQITIPLPLVPITGQTLAIGLAATILGSRYGSFSVILYLIIGSSGVPVFAEFSGGFSKLIGPTGGYLVGFLPTAFLIGWFMEKTSFNLKNAVIANSIGMLITLTFGTVWLKVAANLSWTAAFAGGFTPFIVVGLIKASLASWIGILVRNRLISAKLLFSEKNNLSKSA
ncbi:biotin transporter BioY [Bacillus sp. EB106-08-02-XG196]|jgi:biotin transport system substrate-specific component|uniref:biotin transporter BioY n=1 Tax=unclassified Bacillus (in: firmicutes) TaxID=185979 RepID=UPI000BA6649B|nr:MULTISPECIES: biotin transporter BioY [unclassified Bacillus (in: firmicutes)]NWQ43493.1 biotin transporter BioY [Bacillus sp. EB106-08-02-XG196]PAE38620.1 BioY family transporter [Bacillus sp. 7884-1]